MSRALCGRALFRRRAGACPICASQFERRFSTMSLPSFPRVDPPIDREDAVNQILSSIAMEELGLSHILTAEGEKLRCSFSPRLSELPFWWAAAQGPR